MVRHGRHCAVAVCRNHDKSGKDISFFRFPKDPSLRESWISKCKRVDKFNANTARICSDHFRPDDFTRDLRAELLGIKPRKMLVPRAVPSMKIEFEVKVFSKKKKGEHFDKAEKNTEIIHFMDDSENVPSTTCSNESRSSDKTEVER